MIETSFGLGTLETSKAFFFALVIGLGFGFSLEQAGFGSSRRLAGIFYFRDMTVLKVMFTGVLVAMLGIYYFLALGWIALDSIFLMPTIYGAQIVGGLIFGVGFVVGGWCPGTAAVGVASGKMDALVFLVGTVLGSIVFNEVFPAMRTLYSWGYSGVRFVYDSLGISMRAFVLLFTLIAVGCFWGAEYLEKRRKVGGLHFNSSFMKAFSVALVVLAAAFSIFPGIPEAVPELTPMPPPTTFAEAAILETIETGGDHIEPEELADRLLAGDSSLLLVDIRTPAEYESFHIRGAVNVSLPQLQEYLMPFRNSGLIVLYSNGMTHPAQARDSLNRLGYNNVYFLTDGLDGFIKTCLKPVSLRKEPVSEIFAGKVNAWRRFFYGSEETFAETTETSPAEIATIGLTETAWLEQNLDNKKVKIIDLRGQTDYNTGHIPGSQFLSVESLRGVVGGVPSVLLPYDMLARHLSLMGIEPDDMVILVPSSEKVRDATIVAMAFERLGHRQYGIMNGGYEKWIAENRPMDARLPQVSPSTYPADGTADDFTVDYKTVLEYSKNGRAIIVDVRPVEYYSGQKSDEARAGHIPGALNRPYTEDMTQAEGYWVLKPVEELSKAYSSMIPSKDATVIVHCRTGHQASQTFFVLTRLLGYQNVLWYDAGWTEWAARPELPIETGSGQK